MENDRKILRLGAAVILCATLFRLISGGLPEKLTQAVSREALIQLVMFLQTGRKIQAMAPLAEPEPEPVPTLPQTPEETEPVREETQPLVLTRTDADGLRIQNGSGYTLEVQQLLEKPLSWDLRSEEPTVLILHTHGTESYENTEGYGASSAYRTLDERYNMISVGDCLADCLEEAGIPVIHDRTPYDYPSYSGSYAQARNAVAAYLEENPSICLVLDIHRDAMEDEDGNQIGYTATTAEGTAAKLMLVCGCDAGGLTYPNWQENLSLTLKLQAVLEGQCPGLCRPVSLRTGRYNQDLFPNMVLVEVGAAGNTRQQALLAVQQLAQAITRMADGVVYE